MREQRARLDRQQHHQQHRADAEIEQHRERGEHRQADPERIELAEPEREPAARADRRDGEHAEDQDEGVAGFGLPQQGRGGSHGQEPPAPNSFFSSVMTSSPWW